jgi:predicted esterase
MEGNIHAGTSTFEIEVPYKIIETGEKGEAKPLIVYLHGYNQNIEYFEKKVTSLKKIKAYHLFIQGPYPIYDSSRRREVSKWGRAWYLYDGNQPQFIRSMEHASSFIDGILNKLKPEINSTRCCIFGYSMGGYLGGYFAFSRPETISELIVAGGRIKAESFEGQRERAKHIHILAVHGREDTSVYPQPQINSIELLQSEGFKATYTLVDSEHKLTDAYIRESKMWLLKLGYVEM